MVYNLSGGMIVFEGIIENCTLFQGLSKTDREYALTFFEARSAHYEKGDFLNRIGDPLPAFGLVLSGTIQVYMDDIDGQPMIMANVSAGGTFGESLNFLGTDTAVYIYAFTDADVLWMKSRNIRSRSGPCDPRDTLLSNRFTAMLAGRTLDMNNRIQILSNLTLREKLITFFSQAVSNSGSTRFTLPFDRESMAVYLGTNRSALSRELSKMRDEGIISFQKNEFTIIKKNS